MDTNDRLSSDVPTPDTPTQEEQQEMYQLMEEYVLIPPSKDLPVGRAS